MDRLAAAWAASQALEAIFSIKTASFQRGIATGGYRSDSNLNQAARWRKRAGAGRMLQAYSRDAMKKLRWAWGFVLLAVVAYLALWPVPTAPVSWKAPAASGVRGAARGELGEAGGLKLIDLGGEEGPSTSCWRRRTLHHGAQRQHPAHEPDSSGREVFANTGGRVLGFDFDAAGS